MQQEKLNASTIEKVTDLSKAFLRHFHRHDTARCLSVCAPDIIFIGNTQDTCAVGMEQLRALMDNTISRLYQGYVGDIDTTCTLSCRGGMAIVTARYLVASDPSSGHMVASHNQATLAWGIAAGSETPLALRHAHISTPLSTMLDYEDSQNLNRETYWYAKAVLNQLIRRTAVSIRDVSGALHYLSPAEILFIEANRQRSVVHSIDETFLVRKGFKELVAEFGDGLVIVHRSFAVSPLHIKAVRGNIILMDDGSEVPLPQRRCAEIKRMLDAAVSQASGVSSLKESPPRKRSQLSSVARACDCTQSSHAHF